MGLLLSMVFTLIGGVSFSTFATPPGMGKCLILCTAACADLGGVGDELDNCFIDCETFCLNR